MLTVPTRRPLVSVISTAGSDVGSLETSLRSLLAQSFTGWEWVVVIDHLAWRPGSPDPRVRLILDDRASDPADAQPLAVALALGELLADLEPGRELDPDALASVVRTYDRDPDLDTVTGPGGLHSYRRSAREGGNRADA